MVAPAGAVAPGGADYLEENLRRTAVIGEQLAAAVLRLLDGAVTLDAEAHVQQEPFFTRLSNVGFRVLLVVDDVTGRADLGHEPATLFTCPALGPKTDATASPTTARRRSTPFVVTHRVGDHVKTAVEYLQIGPVGMMFLTGEVPSEIALGLPIGFR